MWCIILRFFQRAKMSESPGDTIAVSFHIAAFGIVGSQNFGNITGNAGFFGYTKFHLRILFSLKVKWNVKTFHFQFGNKACKNAIFKLKKRGILNTKFTKFFLNLLKII